MITIRPLIAASAMACASLSWAGAPALIEFGRHVPGFQYGGPARYAIADFDRDGRDDLVVSAESGTALFQVFGQGATGIVSKQAVFLPDPGIAQAQAVTIAGDPQLVTVSTDGIVRRFAGWPLAEVHSFDAGAVGVVAAAVGDIDHDGELDVVIGTSYWGWSLRANVLLDGTPRWSLPGVGGSDILLGQFDADAALEIVLAVRPGYVIDGATQATDWSYKDGFGQFLAAGRFQSAGGNQFIAGHTYGPIVAFQSAPWSPLWDIDSLDVTALATADFDGDGFDDIVTFSGAWSDINIIDGRTQTIALSFPSEGIDAGLLAGWDHDGDGRKGVVFGASTSTWQMAPLAHLADAEDGSLLWTLGGDQPPPYQHLAVGRRGTGFTLVYPFGQDSYGGWQQLDAVFGTAQWRTPPYDSSDDTFGMKPMDTLFTHGGTQLVIAGGDWFDGTRFVALDPQSHAPRWILDGTSNPLLVNRDVADLAAFDLAGASTIAACLRSHEGNRLALIDATTGALAWHSVAMGDQLSTCGVLAGRFTDAGNPLVAVVLNSSLRAYDAVTHLLAWTMPGTFDGASLIEQGVAGREIVVFEGSELRFYDAGSHTLLRSFDLGMPISAVKQVRGDIHGLLVAADGHLLVVDGTNGGILLATPYLGFELGKGNRIATVDLGLGYAMVGIGSSGGVFRYRLYTGDGIFADGFEPAAD